MRSFTSADIVEAFLYASKNRRMSVCVYVLAFNMKSNDIQCIKTQFLCKNRTYTFLVSVYDLQNMNYVRKMAIHTYNCKYIYERNLTYTKSMHSFIDKEKWTVDCAI